MRGPSSVVRVALAVCTLAFVTNCGDDPAAPNTGTDQPTIAFATATNGAGLSITTDKDDYAPGDTVWFTGTGWMAGDTVDIVLTDDPTLDTHRWMVYIGEDGTFRDSTYVADINDAGVTFTLVATSRGNPAQTLTVTFTDGTLSLAAPLKPSGSQSFPVPNPFPAAGLTFTAANSDNPAGAHTNVTIRIRTAGNLSPTPPAIQRSLGVSSSLAAGSQASVSWDGNNASALPLAEGLYGVRVFSTQRTEQNNSDLDILIDRTAPAISNVALSLTSVVAGTATPITLTGTATDPAVSGVNANNYAITTARYQLDGAPAGGTVLAAVDGNFNSRIENLTATIAGATVAGLAAGTHLFCLRSTDASGNEGAFAITGNVNCATLQVSSADAQAPAIDCTVPDQSVWHGVDVTVGCTASDPSGLANPSQASFSLSTGVAAGNENAIAQTNSLEVCDLLNNCSIAGPYTFKVDRKAPAISCGQADGAWHADNVAIACTASDGGSGLASVANASFGLSTTVPDGTETDDASTGSHVVADNVGNSATAGPVAGNMIDRKDPAISCGNADGAWHADNVTIACTAGDGGSGLANASEASFGLSTTVLLGNETANASTGTRTVQDAVGNSTTAGPIAGNKVDRKAPQFSCAAADGLWHATDVTIACTGADGGSGLANSAADGSFNLTTDIADDTETTDAETGTRNVADAVGNIGTAGPIGDNMVDKKGPTVNLVCPVVPVILNSSASANWTATDGGSGVASGYGSGSISLVTSSVGSKTAIVAGNVSKDKVDNGSDQASCSYSVIYLWTGFFQPVDNTNLNITKAGSAIPVKFNLGGNQGLAIFAAGYPSSTQVNCDAITEDQDTIEETVNAGQSSLVYDAVAGQYVYVWKTDKSWAGKCRRLDVKLNDGTTHSAFFKFKN
jgi:hypothetical protein